jgi:hypothetical protein
LSNSNYRPGSFLQIAGDPTVWGLRDVVAHPDWTDPVALPIILPVEGTLVLSPAAVGGLALSYPDEHNGWMPAAVTAPQLYIPTATGLKAGATGYPLAAPDNDVEALTEKLITAMSDGSTITVALGLVLGGAVMINGAVLPFAVVMAAGPS